MDTGNKQLAKRHRLKPEAVDHSSGGVRLRIIDTDTLTILYHNRVVSDVQYSLGVSFIKDYWRAGLSGKPAQNLEANSSGGYHNYIPYGVSAMQKFRKAADHLINTFGDGAVTFLISCSTEVINLDHAGIDRLKRLLDSLEDFYQSRSPTQEIRKLLSPIS
jgi:hypothetical protein